MQRTRNRIALLVIVILLVVLSPPSVLRAAVVSSEPAWQDVRSLTTWIDEHLAARWQADGIAPAEAATDAQWLRRVYLDLAGVIPSVWEVREFLANETPDRYERVVDRLLESPAHATHFARELRKSLLSETDANRNLVQFIPNTEQWLRNQFVEGRPYDEVVRDILICELAPPGTQTSLFQNNREASPVGFFGAKGAKPENLAASTARQFLGVRIECAQCHDHPFADWKQEEFWQLAAFFASIQRSDEANEFSPVTEDHKIRTIQIEGTKQKVEAAYLDGGSPEWNDDEAPRVRLAQWITARDNPYFARTTVNRLWATMFGTGLVEPIDDFDPQNPASHPELLDKLADEFVAQDYDLRFILRSLALTRAYRLSSDVTDDSQANPRDFAVMPVRGLSAEQFLISIDRATGIPPEDFLLSIFGGNLDRMKFLETFKNRSENPAEYDASPIQALALMNGQIVALATSVNNSRTLAAVLDYPGMATADRVETLFLATLSRPPSDEEREQFVAYVESEEKQSAKNAALADVFWVLLNSSEFAFNH